MTHNHIDVLLDKRKRKQIILKEQDLAFNTEVVTILMDITRALGRQGLSFRGSDNDENGNFQQVVKLISRHNLVLMKWLEDARFRPYHTSYLSAFFQNEMIEVLTRTVRKKIVSDVQEVDFYGIMADTTPDASHQDRLAVGVTYVDKDGRTQERLLEVAEAVDKTGVGLANQIALNLTKN